MILTIDVSERNFITISANAADGERQIRRPGRTEEILPMIEAAMRKWRFSPAKINSISVRSGESFSAARAAVSIANALGLAWKKPVSTNGTTFQKVTKVTYTAAPDIGE